MLKKINLLKFNYAFVGKIYRLFVVFLYIFLFSVLSFSESKWENFTTKDGLINNIVRSIAKDKDIIWFGTAGGLSCFNKPKEQWQNYTTREGLSSNDIRSVVTDVKNNIIWIATSDGLNQYNKTAKTWKNFKASKDGLSNNSITALLLDENKLWIGTENGLSVYDISKNSFTVYTTKDGLFDNAIRSIFLEGDTILVGTVGAVINIFDKNMNKWKQYVPEQPIYTNIVITTDKDNIWAGTNGGGIRKFNETTKTWKRFTSEEGLGDDFVQAIASDGEYIWFGTFDGVTRYNVNTSKWQRYTVDDGLIDGSIGAIAVDGNYVWFGTDSGISRFNKEFPEVKINLTTTYVTDKSKALDISCLVSSFDGIEECKAEYSTFSFPDIWLNAGISTQMDGETIKIKWELNQIPSENDQYYLRLKVKNKSGFYNENASSLRIDTIMPEIDINAFPNPLPTGLYRLTGTFNKSNIEEIIVKPLGKKARFENRAFSCLINLEEGENSVTVTIKDRAGRENSKTVTMFAKKGEGGPSIVLREEEKTKSRLILNELALFDSGKAELKESSLAVLDKIIEILQENNKSTANIEGHTDNVPIINSTNLALSEARAKNVFYYLVNKGKIDASRLKVKGYGETKPVASNDTAEGKAKNRRVEIVITNNE